MTMILLVSAYMLVSAMMSLIIHELHALAKRPLSVETCVSAGTLWPLSILALIIALVWVGVVTVARWFRAR